MKSNIYLCFLAFAVLSLSETQAQPLNSAPFERPPLNSVYFIEDMRFQLNHCAEINLTDEHLGRKEVLSLYALTPEQVKTFNFRRKIILSEVANKLKNQTRLFQQLANLKACFSKKQESAQQLFEKLLIKIDQQILHRAKEIVSCEQYGFCSSIGFKGALGMNNAFAALGAYFTRDQVKSFGSDQKWQTHYSVDLEVGTKAHSPTVVLFLGYKFYVHFDRKKSEDIKSFSTLYLPISPVVVSGADIAGAGATLGFGVIPFVSQVAAFTSQTIRLQPDLKSVTSGCEQFLSLLKNRIFPTKDLSASSPQATYDWPPDDIQ